MPTTGYFSLILHAHLPFVRHPEHDDFLEEYWFFEALTECYLPLLDKFFNLTKREIPFKLTISLSPPLLAMLHDPLLKRRFLRHLNRSIELAEKELLRTKGVSLVHDSAEMYFERLNRMKKLYVEDFATDITGAFKKLHSSGHIELITSAATHAYLPLLSVNPAAVRSQIQTGLNEFKKHLGFRSRGIWLPECSYSPELDAVLKEEGVTFFFTETHGILHAAPQPKLGIYAPIYNRNGTAAFGRDPESSSQVWSADEGYPGDPFYRDFYRDIGYDLPQEYIAPYVQPDGGRKFTGIKYYRISNKGNEKEFYYRKKAIEKTQEHAKDFFLKKQKQSEKILNESGTPPLITAPFDAELFGHWWFEGPEWLSALLEHFASENCSVRLTTPSDFLKIRPVNQMSAPAVSSWGSNGYNDVWLDETNNWIYPLLHKAADRMEEIANGADTPTETIKRALTQAGRELMLAQSSDWAFMMKTGTSAEYATLRTKDHISNFNKLYDAIKEGSIDNAWLHDLEIRNNIFPDLDYKVFLTPTDS